MIFAWICVTLKQKQRKKNILALDAWLRSPVLPLDGRNPTKKIKEIDPNIQIQWTAI